MEHAYIENCTCDFCYVARLESGLAPLGISPLPWVLEKDVQYTQDDLLVVVRDEGRNIVVDNETYYPQAVKPHDAAYIAYACTNYPAKAKRVKELEGALARLIAEGRSEGVHSDALEDAQELLDRKP